MPFFALVILVRVAVATIRALRRKTPTRKLETLCAQCRYAHVQYAANAKQAISCSFGGGLRAVTLDVLYCTDFEDRNKQVPARGIGFVQEILEVE